MARQPANMWINSLKGKIQIASALLAFFVLIFGLAASLILSFAESDTFLVLFVPFLLLSGAVIALGWWLSGEILKPVERISLLAKSLERGAAVSLPKTSGSTETDELLNSLHRSSKQLQNVVGLMDKVAGGEIDAALAPLENSDRLSDSFQKLLAKVSESVQAKQDLESVQRALRHLEIELSPVKKDRYDVEITSGFTETKEISAAIQHLIERLGGLIARVKAQTQIGESASVEVRKIVRTVIQAHESEQGKISQIGSALAQAPRSLHKFSEELSFSSSAAEKAIAAARNGADLTQENLKTVGSVRRQVQEAVNRIQKLSARAKEIGKAAKTVEDLSHRTNMIALNASLQAAKNDVQSSGGFSIVAEEVERLAVRAENTNKHISLLNKTIAAEIGEIEHSLHSIAGEAVALSGLSIETGNALGEVEKCIGQIANQQSKLIADSAEKCAQADELFETLTESFAVVEKSFENLKESETLFTQIADAVEMLKTSVVDFERAPVSGDPLLINDFQPPINLLVEENI